MKIIQMSDETRRKIEEVAEKIKGKVIFKDSVERAKEMLKNIKNLPL